MEPLSPARKLPIIFNVTTGQWEEVAPEEAEHEYGIPIGPPVDADILNRMWGGRPGEAPLLNRDLERST
jgi:hypothetical protein